MNSKFELLTLIGFVVTALIVVIFIFINQETAMAQKDIDKRIQGLENRSQAYEYVFEYLLNNTRTTEQFKQNVIDWHDDIESRMVILNETKRNK